MGEGARLCPLRRRSLSRLHPLAGADTRAVSSPRRAFWERDRVRGDSLGLIRRLSREAHLLREWVKLSTGGLRRPPVKESTKRVIDWLTLIPIGFIPGSLVWFHYMNIEHPPSIWLVFLVIDIVLAPPSIIWLIVRGDRIPIVHWYTYSVATSPWRVILFGFCCLAIVMIIKWVWR